MKINLVISKKMEPIPDAVKVVEDYGNLRLFQGTDHPPDMYYEGKHVVVEGETEAIKDWLRPFDGVWIGNGIPMTEQFVIGHIA